MSSEAAKAAQGNDEPNVMPERSVIPIAPKPASSIRLLGTGTDFHLVFETRRLFIGDESSVINEPTAVVVLSLHTLKDLAVMAFEAVKAHEDQFGEISTPFTRTRPAKPE